MRILIIALFALFAAPAFAQGIDHYDNDRFGYGIDIPAGFGVDSASDNGDGISLYNPSGAKGLLVWGGNFYGDFESEVAAVMGYATEDGWNITYQAVTPRWASFSGTRSGRFLYQRMVLLCDGSSYGAFRAEYSVSNLTDMDSVIERLVQSLRARDC